ncbi:MAG: tetratricopeptide repeat protein [Saprospiraceae bacterium]|nr:tetratricopeptide repeat protein [Saprospiraceae bacterium]
MRSLEIYERLSNSDPAQFEPYLGSVARNLAVIYKALEKMREAEKMYGRSLEIFERLAKSNPAQFEPDLAITVFNLGNFFLEVQKMPEAEKMYQRSMEIFERLSKQNPAQFEPALAITLNNFGKFQQTNNAFSKAQDLYSRALSIRKNQMLNGQSHFREALDLVYGNMASLRNSFEKIKNYDAVVAIQLDRAICMDSLSTLDVVFLKRAANDYGSISWYAILARKYSEAKAAGEKALSIDPSQNWVHCNFGHIYLLQHKWSKAKIIYKKFLSVEKDPVAAKSAIVKDFDYLEAAGITCPEMAKARAWLRN